MSPSLRFATIALTTGLLLGGCAQYATVSETRPIFKPAVAAAGAVTSIERGFTDALRKESRDPIGAMSEYLSSAKQASDQLAKNPSDVGARNAYNFAVARVIGTIDKAHLDPWSAPMTIPAAGGDFVLTHKPDPRPSWNPKLYNFTPADQFDIGGTYVTKRERKEGVGAPVVAIGRAPNKDAAKDYTIPRVFYGVTGLVRFEGRRAIVSFEDPLATERVTLGNHVYPLAADFTVPLAVLLAKAQPKKMELTRLLRPGKYAETARIARLQPYDPKKTVVLVVHGLMDSPATWTPMINSLRADPEIRSNYQFWFYSYPSGYPYPYSAAILRRELDAIQKRYPLHKKMVLIGHSMGGCISRLLITDTGDKLWTDIFRKPPAEVNLSRSDKALLSEALIFKHRPEVGRVIFISAPLKGSDLASNWVGRIGSMLIKSPSNLVSIGRDALKVATFQPGELQLNRIPNSVDTLAPNNRFVLAINRIPVTPGIPHNVICGDRGKGGNKDHTPPVMADGVVPYWSSHMETAQSEKIVPSNHSAHQNPQAIEEVRRILKLNAGVSR